MAIIIQGQIGEQVSLAPGSDQDIRMGANAELVMQELHGRYYETTYRGHMFSAANQAAQAVSAALATTYTGIGLYNPPASGYNLVLNKIGYGVSAAPAGIFTLGLIQCWAATGAVTTQTAVLTAISNKIGGAKGVGIPLSQATITTPTWLATILSGNTSAALPVAPYLWTDLEGSVIIQPGGFVGIGALTAFTGLGCMNWEEVPV